MPKIRKHEYRQSGGNKIEVDIKYGVIGRRSYDNSTNWFYINYPPDMAVAVGAVLCKAATEKEVVDLFDKAAKEYFEATMTSKKMLLIQFDYVLFVEGSEPTGSSRYSSFLKYVDKNGELPKQELSFRYQVGWLFEISGKQFFDLREDGTTKRELWHFGINRFRSTDEKTVRLIDWTQEREDWLAKTYAAFSKMIESCKSFIAQDEEKLTAFIDNGGKKLLQ